MKKILKKVQRNCNKYIQLRDLSKSVSGQVFAQCISCNRIKEINCSYDLKEFHAGHYFLENKYASVRFDTRNINGQCQRCNRRLSGNLSEYKIALIDKIGLDEFEQLEKDKNKIKIYTFQELENLNKWFLTEIKKLKNELGDVVK